LTLEAPARVRTDERVPLVFTVTNAGRTILTLQLLGRTPTADFQVSDTHGRLVWSKLHGQTMLGSLQLFPLEPGKHLSFRHTWDQRTDAGRPVAEGEYLVRGVLLTDVPGGLASSPARIRVERRAPR
jgi:Intracellular proteinase inhibitor